MPQALQYGYFRFLLFVMIIIPLSSCDDKMKYNDDNSFGSKIIILGHRGMGTGYRMPGNTFQSVNPGINIGLDGCELDVQITRDTELIFFHDHLLNPQTTCSGRIYEYLWTDIRECKYYVVQNTIFINSADELFRQIPNLNELYFSFDCGKVDQEASDVDLYELQLLRAIKRLCEKYNMSDRVFIEGDMSLLIKAKNMGMTNKLFLYTYLDETGVNAAYSNSFFGISTGLDEAMKGTKPAHDKGLYVMVWSPDNYSQNIDAINSNVDIIQTDDPISLLKLLERFNYNYIIP